MLAAAVLEAASIEHVREIMLGLRGRRATKKLHWNEMDLAQQQHAAKEVAALDGMHIVTIGTPLPLKRQERARAACLRMLVRELHGYGVTDLILEGRTNALNRRDIATVTGARFDLPKGARFRIHHTAGAAEPLLWTADIVAGAIRARYQGELSFHEILADCVYEVEVPTGC